MAEKTLKIKLVKSANGRKPNQMKTLKAFFHYMKEATVQDY